MVTRRQFGLIAGGALAGPAALRAIGVPGPGPGPVPGPGPSPFEAHTLQSGATVLTGAGGNSLLMPTSNGPVLVDAKVCSSALAFRAQAIRAAGRPPVMLINTHHHADHVGGNYAFADDAEIVAQRRLRAHLPATIDERITPELRKLVDQLRSEGRDSEADTIQRRLLTLELDHFAADREVEDDLELNVGGVRIQLIYMGPGHTDNDLAVFLPAANVLHTGDLLFHRLHPFIDREAGASTRSWQSSLIALVTRGNEKTVVVPGHGDITDLNGLVRQHYYFMRMRDLVAEQMAAGRSRDEVVEIRADEFKSFGFGNFRRHALGVLFDELVAEAG